MRLGDRAMISIEKLHADEGGKCYYCNCDTLVPKYRIKRGLKMIINNPKNGSREHLIPESEGGLGNRINIKLACSECNTRIHKNEKGFKIFK